MDVKQHHIKVFYTLEKDCECDKQGERFGIFGCECNLEGEKDRIGYLSFRQEHDPDHDQISRELAAKVCAPEGELHISQVRWLPFQWLNVYLEDRAYGGPEEGGWWYTTGSPRLSIPLIPSILAVFEHVKADLQREYSNEGRPPMGSTQSQGEFKIAVEYEEAKAYPPHPPRYQ